MFEHGIIYYYQLHVKIFYQSSTMPFKSTRQVGLVGSDLIYFQWKTAQYVVIVIERDTFPGFIKSNFSDYVYQGYVKFYKTGSVRRVLMLSPDN